MYDSKPTIGYKKEGFIDQGLILPLLKFINQNKIEKRHPNFYPSFKETYWYFFPHCYRFSNYKDILEKEHMKRFKELYDECDPILLLLESKFQNFIILDTEINVIPPKQSLKKHVDSKYWHLMYSKRIHVVLETNNKCFFHIKDQSIQFETGEIFEFNNSVVHSVENKSTTQSRTHLVVDLIPIEDKELFDNKLKESKAHIHHWRNIRPIDHISFEKNVL